LKSKNYDDNEIGIITPFRAQCNLLRNELEKINSDNSIIVDTVERFQGSERKVIIISTTVNHTYQLKQIESSTILEGENIDRKLNVAITRAKEKLFVIGNKSVLKQSPMYQKLIEFIEDKYTFINFEEMKTMEA